MVKGVIFDLDGVLVHTDEFHYLSWKQLTDRLGLPFDRTVNNRLRGVSRMDSLEIILGERSGEFSDGQKLAIATEKNEIFRAHLATMSFSSVDSDTRSTLLKLRQAGFKLAVGSSSKNAPYILERTELMQYFDAVVDGNAVQRSKPHPEVFLKAAERLGLAPSECLVVEDGHSGIDAAKAGGFIAVAIGDAKSHKMADHKIGGIGELLSILKI